MLACETFGLPSTPSVVFLHGFPLNHHIWHQQTTLDDTYHLFFLDLPGFGASPLERPPSRVTIDWMAEQVRELLDDRNLSEVVMVGHSMGGYVTLAFAEKYPERLAALGLVCSHARADTDEVRQRRMEQIARVRKDGVRPVADTLREVLFAPDVVEHLPELVDWVYNLMLEASPRAVIGALYAMARRPDRLSVLARWKKPALFLAGMEDRIVSRERQIEMAQAASDSTLIFIPESGHMAMLEQPEAVNDALRDFLERVYG